MRFAAVLTALGLALAPRGPSQQPPPSGRCGDCRVAFMKCMVAGKDLPPDQRKEHNAHCGEVAGDCYKACE
jgi:hypothetical protein